MKKMVLIFLLTVNLTVFSQNLLNSSFETWTNKGTYEDPNNWITFNMFSTFSASYPIGVTKTTDAHTGSYACMLETKLDESDTSVVSAFLFSGTGDVFSGLSYIPNTVRPALMSFYYKYLPVNGDTSSMSISLTKWDSLSNSQVQIGSGALSFISSNTNFTLAQIPIEYLSTDAPDTMLIVFATSTGELPQVGTKLTIDEITFSMSGLSLADLNLISSSVYPNPAKNEVQFEVANAKPTELVLTDLNGKIAGCYNLSHAEMKVDVSNLRTGTYLYELKENNKTISKGKMNVVK